jgi:hypothetical protein
MNLFWCFLVSYRTARNDLPIVIALPSEPVIHDLANWTLADFAADVKEHKHGLLVFKPNGTIRRTNNVIPDSLLKTWNWNNSVVYQNATEIFELINGWKCPIGSCNSTTPVGEGQCAIYENCNGSQYHELWNQALKPLNAKGDRHAVIWVEHSPTWDYGLPNPFTATVWNSVFVIVFLVLLATWAVVQFSKIDVQTRFAKKIA